MSAIKVAAVIKCRDCDLEFAHTKGGTRPHRCPACRPAYEKRWHADRAVRYRATSIGREVGRRAVKKYKVEAQDFINEVKSNPCTDCGNCFHVEAMEFDHVRGVKVKDISRMLSFSRDALLDELLKCDLVCANCHRVRTWERRQSRVAD